MGNESYSNSHYRSHTASIFQKYNILNVYDSYKFEVGVFMYQYFQNLLPSSFTTFFSKRSDMYMIITQEIGVTSIRLEIKRSLLIKQSGLTGPTIWNSTDDKIKKAISSNHFRKSFKSLLIDTNE